MLEIQDVRYLPDGRSLIDCVGGRRFRVISRGQRDGYNTAVVQYLVDTPLSEDQRAGKNTFPYLAVIISFLLAK